MADLWPQWLNLTNIAANGSTYAESETKTPVSIGINLVMEILIVQFAPATPTAVSAGVVSADEDLKINNQLTKNSKSGIVTINDPDLIDRGGKLGQTSYAETTETGGAGIGFDDSVIHHDFASSGKGFLYGGTSIFHGTKSETANTGTQSARILYKLRKVSAQELVGIVGQ